MRWNCLSILKLQRSLDKQFHHTLYNRCNHLNMLGLTPIHIDTSGSRNYGWFAFVVWWYNSKNKAKQNCEMMYVDHPQLFNGPCTHFCFGHKTATILGWYISVMCGPPVLNFKGTLSGLIHLCKPRHFDWPLQCQSRILVEAKSTLTQGGAIASTF